MGCGKLEYIVTTGKLKKGDPEVPVEMLGCLT